MTDHRADVATELAQLLARRQDGERATDETPAAILRAHQAGMSGREIARALDLGESYVYRKLREARKAADRATT